MGKFELVSFEGIKTYTVFSKNSFKNILRLDYELPMYNFIADGRSLTEEIFFDSTNNLLASAGIILSKVVRGNSAFFRIEREDYLVSKNISTEKKVFVHPAGVKDSVADHAIYLIDGITSLFTTKFNIDFENILKVVVPKIEIITKTDSFKILSGSGFKGLMEFEEVKFKNNFSRQKAGLFMLKIGTSTKTKMKEFENFTEKLEKYCKEIIPISDSKFKIAQRITQNGIKK